MDVPNSTPTRDRNAYARPAPVYELRVAEPVESRTEVPVVDVLPDFADAFPFETFNAMQAETLPALLETEENVVVSAPTA